MSSENNRRIAKNTGMLYIRMLLIMAVSLYTSRIVLNVLGIEDFGIYNVVGGFVTMFGFLNSAMASATQRFLSFEIGRNEANQLKNVFSMSVNIHFIIALIILIFAETVGLWIVNSQLIIPTERLIAAKWVYQFSIFTLLVNMVSVPYNAIIIAHERMHVFAWVSIAEVILNLLIVYMLMVFGFDKLKLYSILMFVVSLIIRLIYGIYCNRNFKENKFRLFWDRNLYKTLMSYAGWNLWGNAANVIMVQGVNILLNIFFGPAVNAARGMAFQIRGAVNNFVQNFQMAINPQVIKSFATNDLKYMHLLIFQGAKYSFFLVFALSLPILLETEIILKLWLKIVPEYTVIFSQLVIVNVLIDSISGPLMTAAHASGKIKLYQGVVGGILLLILPVSYIFLKLGFAPEVTLYVSIATSFVTLFVRLSIVSKLVYLSFGEYFINVIFRIIPVALITILITLIIQHFLSQGFLRLILICISSELTIITTIYLLGLQKNEQLFIQRKLKYLLFKNN